MAEARGQYREAERLYREIVALQLGEARESTSVDVDQNRAHLADDQNDDNDDEDFIRITKIINGGAAGLKSRQAYWARAKDALGLPVAIV